MPDWRAEYLVNLQEAERRNPVNQELIEACSQLADRIAALEAEKAVLQAATPTSSGKTNTTSTSEAATSSSSSSPETTQLKLELSEALRSKGQLQSRLKKADAELVKLRAKSKADDKKIASLTAERNTFMVKLKDRNEELSGKNKMLKDVQDENLTLNIQIDVTERKMEEIKKDNKELTERWMKRIGQEADAMNQANESRHVNGR